MLLDQTRTREGVKERLIPSRAHASLEAEASQSFADVVDRVAWWRIG